MNRVIACIDSSPCINAIADAAACESNWTRACIITNSRLLPGYHLGEISGVIGFESNAMLLKELAELEQNKVNSL